MISNREKTLFFLSCILIASVVLRCLFIEHRGIQYDDAFSMLLAKQNLADIIQGTAADTMPPGYYLLLHLWMSVSGSIWWCRLLSVLLNMGSIFLAFYIFRQLFSERTGLIAAALTGISPFQIYHAQDIRMYAMLEFFHLAFFTLFIGLERTTTPGKMLLYALGMVLTGSVAMYTHNLAIFFLIVPFFCLVLKRNWAKMVWFVGVMAGIILLFYPWGVELSTQLGKIQNAFWTPRPGLLEIIQAMVMFTGILPVPDWLLPIILSLSLLIWIFLFFNSYILSKNYTLPVDVLFFIFLPPAILFILSYFMRPLFVPRGFITSSIFFYGWLAYVVDKYLQKVAGIFLISSFLLSSLISLPFFYTFDQFPRSPFRTACQSLIPLVNEGDVVIHENKLSFFPCKIYAVELPQNFIVDEPNSFNDTLAKQTQKSLNLYPLENIEEGVSDTKRVFFVSFVQTQEEYMAAGLEDPNIKWLRVNFSQKEILNYKDLQIYVFVRSE